MIVEPGINGHEIYDRIIALEPTQKAIVDSALGHAIKHKLDN